MNSTSTPARASWPYRVNAKIQSIHGYRTILRGNFNAFSPFNSKSSSEKAERRLNKLLLGYPRNHNFRVHKKKLIPSFRLYERLRLVRSAYPNPLESFLDIGCSRGFYVMDAAQRPDCRASIGTDVYEPFICTANEVRKYLEMDNACFHLAGLEDVADAPENYGGPFQTILLIGTYHYLFWGSSICPTAYHSHREILTRLSRICIDRVILSGRLEVNKLQRSLKEKARSTVGDVPYSTAEFINSAKEFFEVRTAGYLGTYPLFVMLKK